MKHPKKKYIGILNKIILKNIMVLPLTTLMFFEGNKYFQDLFIFILTLFKIYECINMTIQKIV
jgi:hypothetical protein